MLSGGLMKKKLQTQSLALQHTSSHSTIVASALIQPTITLPVRRESLVLPATPGQPTSDQDTLTFANLEESTESAIRPAPPTLWRKQKLLRSIALIICLLLGLTVYVTWRSMNATAASPAVIQPDSPTISLSATVTSNDGTSSSNGTIQVYILGAVKHPGVYSLPADARIYQLVQAAGGLLPGANMVALNMAARLSDGEEVYVLMVGEHAPPGLNDPSGSGNGTPGPSTQGQLVNINTATATEMRQALHVSAATAQKIIDYRTQHGLYTAVDQLLQVVSQTIYQHIKDLVTV